MNVLKFLWQVSKPFRPFIFGTIIFVILMIIIDMAVWPTINRGIINSVDNKPVLISFIIKMLCLHFSIIIIWRIIDFMLLKYEPALKGHIANIMLEKISYHSHSYFQDNFAGSITNKIINGFNNGRTIINSIIFIFFRTIISLILAIYITSTIHAKFALAMFIWTSLFIFLVLVTLKKYRNLSYLNSVASTKVVATIVDIISNISTIRFFVGRKKEQLNLSYDIDYNLKTALTRRWFVLKMQFIQGLSFFFYQAFCMYMLVNLYEKHLITVGDFAMLMTINFALIDMLWNLGKELDSFSEQYGSLQEAINIMEQPQEIYDLTGAKDLQIDHGRIDFCNVGFSYKNSKVFFNDINIKIEANEKIGLVGYSGGGKTSFVNLILRLFDVNKGKILIDNQDIRLVTLDSLRKKIAIIPQDPALFHRSLMENIRYGRLDATDEEVIDAAKRAHAHEFIACLPLKYDSLVGERGIKLSGGQRQRIAIARAILKNAPILILDEATSQLDSVTEHLIQDSLKDLMNNKTVIVIAHRLSTLIHMDRILVFDEGKIVQDNTHAGLLLEEGLYKKLWNAQVGGFLPDKKDDNNLSEEDL